MTHKCWLGQKLSDEYFEHEAECDECKADALRDLAALRARVAALEAERDEARGLHQELMFQVGSKFPGETRHETAKRYIREHEEHCGKGGPYAALTAGKET